MIKFTELVCSNEVLWGPKWLGLAILDVSILGTPDLHAYCILIEGAVLNQGHVTQGVLRPGYQHSRFLKQVLVVAI